FRFRAVSDAAAHRSGMRRTARIRERRSGKAAGCGKVAFESRLMSALPTFEFPTIPIHASSDRFPVRHIYCVGRNYAEHAKEMGGDASKEPPFFFTKSADRTGERRVGKER